MKKEEIFEMTKHLDEKYIIEAAPASKKNIQLKKKIVAFGLAAAIAATLSLGAFAAYKAFNKESVETYYDSSAIEKLESSGYVSGQVTENEHFKFTLDTAMKDDYNMLAVVTVEALDSAAQQYLSVHDSINVKTTYADTGERIEGASILEYWDKKKSGSGSAMRLNVPVHSWGGDLDLTRAIKLYFENVRTESEKDAEELFEDLSLDISDVKATKNTKFYSKSGKMLNVSEFCIATEDPNGEKILNGGSDLKDSYDSTFPNIRLKDGTAMTIEDKFNAVVMTLTKDNGCVIAYDLNTLIDPDNIESIEYRGETFNRK